MEGLCVAGQTIRRILIEGHLPSTVQQSPHQGGLLPGFLSVASRGGHLGRQTSVERASRVSVTSARAARASLQLPEETAQMPAEDEAVAHRAPGSAQIALRVTPGTPTPLGASLVPETKGVNFALFSQHATAVTLCLWVNTKRNEPPSHEFVLDPFPNRTKDTWHLCVEGLPLSGVFYAYRCNGPGGWETGLRWDPTAYLLDPYAKLVEGRRVFGQRDEGGDGFLGTFDFDSEAFDWGGEYKRPNLPQKDLIIYEMPLRAYTADATSGVAEGLRGSYLGLAEKIDHLVETGVNAVELLPVFEYDELEFQRRKNPRDHLVNTWGYSTVNFFSPMARFASNGGGAVAASREFKKMVKALHAAGIEVILDVVYNHTNESDDEFPYMTSFRGIDNLVYYIVNLNSYVQLANYTGCGNTFNCNHPVVMELVLDSLRHWVTEYHVDGFRFDLASSLCRGTDGKPLSAPPVIRAIAKDPVLSQVKLIAEPWDCGGLYLVGSFPNWDVWSEWNGKYRDDLRCFIKGDPGKKGSFATRIAGSADLYDTNKRKPYHSINFIIAHDGFSLYDLVSYNQKYTHANGEQGRDGSNDNFSWNCGAEGETDNADIIGLRIRQMKNFHLALMISQGTPMVLMGDEYGHTRRGNNNSYGHDTVMNHFLWSNHDPLPNLEKAREGFYRFYKGIIHFRRKQLLLGRDTFLTNSDITWHEDQWGNPESRFLAFTLHGQALGVGDIYAAFNAHGFWVDAALPAPPAGLRWYRVVDTNLPSPDDFVEEGVPGVGGRYNVAPHGSLLLLARP